MTWVIHNLLEQATADLHPSSPTPRLDAELLLADLLGRDRGWLIAHSEFRVPDHCTQTFAARLNRRLNGEPVALITGERDFFGHPIMVSSATLVPRPATELLVEEASRLPIESSQLIVDVGTGSGAIALALAIQRPLQSIIGTDISLPALRLAAANARRLRIPGRVAWRQGTLLEPVEAEHLGLIIANLPYLTPTVYEHQRLQAEPPQALVGGYDGALFLRRLLSQAAHRSDWKGLLIECAPEQARPCEAWMRATWPDATITHLSDGRAVRGLSVWRD